MKIPELTFDRFYCGDCLDIMASEIPAGSIDLIYADPPYNISGKPLELSNNTTGGPYKKINEAWDTWKYDDYVTFTRAWLQVAQTTLKPAGSLYVSCTQHNIAEVIFLAKQLSLRLNNILTWVKSNAMPNITKRTFTHTTEFVAWFVNGTNWKFNYERMKQINPHRTKAGLFKQMRDFIDIVEIPILQGPERLRNEDGRAAHPAQKPEFLLQIIIEASSEPGDIVLDPFSGTGTTAIVAQRLARHWIGIEKDHEYSRRAVERMAAISGLSLSSS